MKIIIEREDGTCKEITGDLVWGGVFTAGKSESDLFVEGEAGQRDVLASMGSGCVELIKAACKNDPGMAGDIFEQFSGVFMKMSEREKQESDFIQKIKDYTTGVIKEYQDDGKEWAFGAIDFSLRAGLIQSEQAQQIYKEFKIVEDM